MKHKYYDAIVAWAEGRVIQCRQSYGNDVVSDWYDVSFNDVDYTPDFSAISKEWRVKPTHYFRVALMENPDGSICTCTSDKEETSVYEKTEVFNRGDNQTFIRWLTDWIVIEI